MHLPLKFWLARGAELTAKLRLHLGVFGALAPGADSTALTLALMERVARHPETLHDLMEAAVDRAERDPGFNELMADHYQPPPPDSEVLAGFAPGTLGHAVAAAALGDKLATATARGATALDLDDAFSFLTARVRQSLPIWRALLPAASDLSLQAFIYAQTACPLPCLLIAVRLYQLAALAPRQLPAAINDLSTGFAAGQSAAYLPGVRLEDEWSTDLYTLRQNLGLA